MPLPDFYYVYAQLISRPNQLLPVGVFTNARNADFTARTWMAKKIVDAVKVICPDGSTRLYVRGEVISK